ncbi:hypothetical protein P153DRAFT_319566 [Dothidotthia symphoricarpi CBS 119687]|uniref:Protein artemis n=1 Tax=Dothidotthia symphoricarpi CBS 119687 TaxID=1392245 RepID=A0A6A6A8M1_9PLEO|nr:uncharacterized protein P153DRAFT_319566 [Dothidotthia symphoricarpi CBS 119687]KAF2128190.1 hypothetical protein P153DRAFT_319566 [Dothidotthia symphoricarpi CBS 119687]
MSTFRGIISEFPQIRIDYFRHQPDHKAPLACFLSHVHSDHLAGLESLRAPFVYCSAATREILLRLEKYHYRINFANNILESHNVTYDKTMRRLAKPLPLDTPTMIELAPGNSIRVTLIDANHCVGAVMFLIEDDGKAVLYTGDIRAETWWVNSLVQNPVLLPYTLGSKRLECMYLDTTFATKNELYREFPSKAQGITELLEEVSEFSEDTVFYFHSWTFGYENVWIALSAFLGERIHVDDYRARVYGSLSTLDRKSLREAGLDVQADNKSLRESGFEIREAPALCGFRNGNHIQSGCLTSRENARIHGCEHGMGCPVIDQDADAKVVHIIPIVTRANGTEIAELGAGGGKGDLAQKEELQTDGLAEISKLMELCAQTITDEESVSKVLALLQRTLDGGDGTMNLDMQLQKPSQDSQDDPSLYTLVAALSSYVSKIKLASKPQNKTIRFSYSRHSSYHELCQVVDAFSPKDVFPCTVDEKNWTPECSMQNLFGEYCSGTTFRHDVEMIRIYEERREQEVREKRDRDEVETQQQDTQTSNESRAPSFVEAKRMKIEGKLISEEDSEDTYRTANETLCKSDFSAVVAHDQVEIPMISSPARIPSLSATSPIVQPEILGPAITSDSHLPPPPIPTSSTIQEKKRRRKMTNRQLAYEAAIGTHLTWADYGGLVSTRRKEDREEVELI